jgi:aryl-alcohol dehydrogenase-like predicted oxidoreductase
LLARSLITLPIPGTTSLAHLEENVGAANIELSPEEVAALDAYRLPAYEARRLAAAVARAAIGLLPKPR